MASANRMKATFISKKLEFLKDRGDHLISDVGLYVSRIITTGESWAEGGDNKLEYLELCHMIDAAVEFLCEKCEELAGGSVDVAANQLSRPSCEQSTITQQEITGTESSSATSYRQTAALLASTATSSFNQPTVSVQPAGKRIMLVNMNSINVNGVKESLKAVSSAKVQHVLQVLPDLHPDEIQLKPVLARIAVIEEALSSFRGNAEKVSEKQSDIDQQLKELLSTISKSDKKHSSRFRKAKEQISEISDVQDAINEEHRTRLQSLERQLQKVTTAQDRLDNVDALDAKIERIIDECSFKHEGIKTVTDDLVDKVSANTHTIQVISECQEQKMTLLKELETRLKTLEVDGGRNVKDFQKQAEKGDANLRILCQMLSDRLTPLEQLRTSLNERASMRDNNINKVIRKAAVMSPRFQQLELKASGTGCGFTAHKLLTEHNRGIAITQYTIKYSTVGNNFDADSGVFTIPFDGLYVASVSLTLAENKEVRVGVRYQPNLSDTWDLVCECSVAVGGTTACSVGVVGLKVGDKVLTSVNGIPKSGNNIFALQNPKLLRYTQQMLQGHQHQVLVEWRAVMLLHYPRSPTACGVLTRPHAMTTVC